MRCRYCHKNIPDDAFFCPYCGLVVEGSAEYERLHTPQVLWRPRSQDQMQEIEDFTDTETVADTEDFTDTEADTGADDNSRIALENEKKEDFSEEYNTGKAEWYSRKPERSEDQNPRKTSKRYIGIVGIIILIMLFLMVVIWLIFSTLDAKERREREERQEALKAEEAKNRQQRKENLARNKGSSTSDEDDADSEEGQEKETSGDITFSLIEEPEDFGDCYRLSVADASASSVIDQEGTDNSAIRAADGNESTSWQEGVDGDGIGENLTLMFARSYHVKYLSLQLGNWNSDRYYEGNNRPKELEITIGDASQIVTFPDGKTEYWLELSSAAEASEIDLTIRSVYSGSQWEDTCIAEISVYGTSYVGNEQEE